MSECAGLWRRTLLVDSDGSRDTATDVRWLQGITTFVDLRRPRHPAAWDGFAGWLRQHGEVFEWERFAGLQPQRHPDAGRMHWDGEVLVETGVHADYVEHWVLEPADGPCWALTLAGPSGAQAVLVRVGGRSGWASRTAGGVVISLGTVGDGWRVTDCSVPACDGMELTPCLRGDELTVDGGVRWTVISSEGDVKL